MGGFLNSSSPTTSKTVATETGVQASDAAQALTVSGGSKIGVSKGSTLSIVQTDHNSIDKVFDFGSEVIGFGSDALNLVENSTDELFDTVGEIQKSNNDFLLESQNKNHELAVTAMSALASSNKENGRLFEKLSDQKDDLFGDIVDGQSELFGNVIEDQADQFSDLSEQNGKLFQSLMSEANDTGSENLETLKHFAETTATGGQNLYIDLLKWLGVGLLLVVAIIAIAAVFWS